MPEVTEPSCNEGKKLKCVKLIRSNLNTNGQRRDQINKNTKLIEDSVPVFITRTALFISVTVTFLFIPKKPNA